MMYQPRSSALSILEKAQGQLSGKRFGTKPSSTWSHQRDEPDEEEDELKAYLSQLQKRTAKPGLNEDLSDEADEVYQPKTSTPLKSGRQFLKSHRAGKPSPAASRPVESGLKQKAIKERRKSIQSDSESISDINDISSDVSSISEEQLGLSTKAARWRKTAENVSSVRVEDKYRNIPKERSQEKVTAASGKSTAYNRIMSNLVSDEEDIMDMIHSIDSNSLSEQMNVPVKEEHTQTKHVHMPVGGPVKVASPLPESFSQPITSAIINDIEDAASVSEAILTDASDSSQGEIKLNLFQAEDLQPAVAGKAEQNQTDEGENEQVVKTDRPEGTKRALSRKQAWLRDDRKDSGRRSEVTEEVKSETESEINTATDSEIDSVIESDRMRSVEEKNTGSYSSVSSRESSVSTSRSSRRSQDLRHFSDSDVSSRRKTPCSSRSRKHSTAEGSLYSEDFDSDTYRSRSVQSSKTLTPTTGATPDCSPTPPATPSPMPRRTKAHRATDTGVQTSDIPYNQNHWIFDHGAPAGRSIDVSELTKDFKTTSVAPETLHALSSINYTSLLLHQTLKIQFQQTQQSIERMLQVHQSLLESVQPDYTYTTLEDTKAYIQGNQENGKK